MDTHTLQLLAGSLSTLLFITSSVPMLLKAARTKNLRSYSLSNMALTNLGNLVHWLYITQLPFGPIWLLHSFYTLTSAIMLVCYLRYEHARIIPRRVLAGARDAGGTLTCSK